MRPCVSDFFAGELAKYGYTAVYKKKTAQVFSQGTYVIDGGGGGEPYTTPSLLIAHTSPPS